MGLFQKAYQTYENQSSLAGVLSEQYREPLAPAAHLITKAQISVTINADGKFIGAESVAKDNAKTIIPVTEKSSGRGNVPCPHPLCDYIGYLTPADEKKYKPYVKQLRQWAESEFSHPCLAPILKYVEGGTLLSDLEKSGIKKVGEKDLVRWTVLGLDKETGGDSWSNMSLFKAFFDYYFNIKNKEEKTLCMLTGKMSAPASQHLKGVVSQNGNAKLLSANDKSNFTYRGRFISPKQAVTVGYEASQKAHNALKWLVANQGAVIGQRTFLCWNPEGKKTPKVTAPLCRERKTKTPLMTDYRKALRDELLAYRNDFKPTEGIVLAAFDAATSGRLALTYYSELLANDFFDRLEKWDATCCFATSDNISSPSLVQIVSCAFGTERKEKLETDGRLMGEQISALLSCRVDCAPLPYSFVCALKEKASNPQAYDKRYQTVLFTACAVIRKYYIDRFGEDLLMEDFEKSKDLSIQYGRLLAVLEVAQRSTFASDEVRDTGAERMQAMYCRKPASTARTIIEQLKRGYFRKLDRDAAAKKHRSSAFYEALIGEIQALIYEHDESEWNKPLTEKYLIGYYLQKNKLYSKTNKENTEEN